MREWQPIETAPRTHGERMLMWIKHKDGSVLGARSVQYHNHCSFAGEFLWLAHWGADDEDIAILARKPARGKFAPKHYATHWMPLPEPPSA